ERAARGPSTVAFGSANGNESSIAGSGAEVSLPFRRRCAGCARRVALRCGTAAFGDSADNAESASTDTMPVKLMPPSIGSGEEVDSAALALETSTAASTTPNAKRRQMAGLVLITFSRRSPSSWDAGGIIYRVSRVRNYEFRAKVVRADRCGMPPRLTGD